ncbi:MAG: PLP-dependent transferase, partial [Chloroflexi bacterium]|nr:PLP-dependent transferase [Chloroflexota bacterium]
ALFGLAQAGDHVIAQEVLYGSADHFIAETLPQHGVSSSRVKGLQAEALARELAAHPNTTAVYLETPANPTMGIIDLAAVVEVAHAHNAKVVVDNTFATPVLQRPLEFGADVVVHSTTKYIGGHGCIIGGALVCRDAAFMEEKVSAAMRFMGAVPSPFDCWLTNLGLKTLPLRMERHSVNGLAVAEFLEGHAGVTAVHYPGLPNFPQHELAKRQMDDFGAMIAFEVKDYEAAARLLGRLQLITLAVSLGNLDTLIEHPASMTHRGLEPEHRAKIGISDGLIRLSVGLEAAEDIIADLEQALK